MRKKKFFLAILAIFFGIILFTSSLITASQKNTLNSGELSKKKFYFGEKILSDHIFYPVLMIVDKSLLSISTGESRIFLRIRLAQDRMIGAHKLLEKGEEVLALSTLTKSQKYLILASHEFLELRDYSKEVETALLLALEQNTQNLSRIEQEFDVIPTDPIRDLIMESEALLEILQKSTDI